LFIHSSPAIPTTRERSSSTPFVISRNLRRRHLDAGLRAIIAAKSLPMLKADAKRRQAATLAKPGERADQRSASAPIGADAGKSTDHAATMMNVGRGSVERAGKVLDKGVPEILAAVEAGKISVSAAATLAKVSPELQREALADEWSALQALFRDAAVERRPAYAEQIRSGVHVAVNVVEGARDGSTLDRRQVERRRVRLDRDRDGALSKLEGEPVASVRAVGSGESDEQPDGYEVVDRLGARDLLCDRSRGERT
jgi:hypothetical protein